MRTKWTLSSISKTRQANTADIRSGPENGWPSDFADGKVTAMGDYYDVRELNCDQYTGKKIPGKILGLWGVGEKKSVSSGLK